MLKKGTKAVDFTLLDTRGEEIRLSSYEGKKHVVLVLMRGFA